MLESREVQGDWRRDLHIKIAWTLVVKFLALALLWALFFRGSPA